MMARSALVIFSSIRWCSWNVHLAKPVKHEAGSRTIRAADSDAPRMPLPDDPEFIFEPKHGDDSEMINIKLW